MQCINVRVQYVCEMRFYLPRFEMNVCKNPNLFWGKLGCKERILWLRLLPGLLLGLLRNLGLLRLSLLQDFESGPVLALVADDLESPGFIQESVTA